ncbi:MAG: hypothetical protein LQ342_008116 [Letrouitia transgressa]|nr:MAG: hypothetical protein LQ342_008116 [Letrouitia transgressa]
MKRSHEDACQEIYRRSRILAAQGGFIGNLAYLAEWPADEAECIRLSGIKNLNTETNTKFSTSQGFQNAAPATVPMVDPSRKAHIRPSSTQSSKSLGHSTPATSRPQFSKSRPLYPFKTMPTAPKRPLTVSNAQNEMTKSISQTSKEAVTVDPILLAYDLNQHHLKADFTFTCPSGSKAEGNNPKLAGTRKLQAEAPPVPLWSKPSTFSGPSIKASANERPSSSNIFDELLAQQSGPIFSEDQDKVIYDALNNACQDMDASDAEESQGNTATDSTSSLLDEDRFYPEKFALSPDEQEDTMSICSEGGSDNDSKSPSDDRYSVYESSTNDDDSESNISSVASDFEDELPVKSRPHRRANRAPKLAQRNHRQPLNKRQKVTKKRGSTAAIKNAIVPGDYQTRSRVRSLRSRKD